MSRTALSFTIAVAMMTGACAKSEPVEGFRPDRVRERVAVSDTGRLSPSSPAQSANDVTPHDQCSTEAGFAAYREKFIDAVHRRDVAMLQMLIADDATVAIGKISNATDLFRRLEDRDSRLWPALAQMLTLGCAFDRASGRAEMPYHAARLAAPLQDGIAPADGKGDISEGAIVEGANAADRAGARAGTGQRAEADIATPTKPKIPLFATADGTAAQITTVEWQSLRTAPDVDWSKPFIALRMPDGKAAYARRDDVRGAEAPRAIFARGKAGGWAMTDVTAGATGW